MKLFWSTYALVFGTMALVLLTLVAIGAVIIAVTPAELIRRVIGN